MSTAKFVRQSGPQVEIVLRVKQASNYKMHFLLPGNVLYPYYRWLVDEHPPVSRCRALVACHTSYLTAELIRISGPARL